MDREIAEADTDRRNQWVKGRQYRDIDESEKGLKSRRTDPKG